MTPKTAYRLIDRYINARSMMGKDDIHPDILRGFLNAERFLRNSAPGLHDIVITITRGSTIATTDLFSRKELQEARPILRVSGQRCDTP